MTLKRSAAPQRKTAPRRSGRIKPKKRSAAEYARIYHSAERVEFVKSLPCAACGLEEFSGNAHVAGDGIGRKSDYTKIIPLCPWCHRRQHDIGAGSFAIKFQLDLRALAAATQRAWLDSLNGEE